MNHEMREYVSKLVAIILFLLFVFCIINHVWGCGGETAEARYGAELLRCVDKAETITESRACRAGVNERWGITDAGRDR